MKKSYVLFVPIALLFFTSFLSSNSIKKRQEVVNYVPNAETAIKVAEAIWLPIYGERIYQKRPFVAKLKDSTIWVVTGTLRENLLGGVPYIEIQKSDCKILKVTHGK
jgi:hypothetical protein